MIRLTWILLHLVRHLLAQVLSTHMGYFGETWKSPFFALEVIGQKMAIFNYRQNTPCGYSKLVLEDTWQDVNGFRSIWSFNPEKTSKMWWKLTILEHFGRFLQTWWMYGPESFCILSFGTSLEYPQMQKDSGPAGNCSPPDPTCPGIVPRCSSRLLFATLKVLEAF